MLFLNQLKSGLRSYWEAILFIKENRYYWFILIPAALMLGIYQLGYKIKVHQFQRDVSTMNGIVWYLIELTVEASIAILFMKFYKYLVMIILSPLLAYISEKTETKLTGNTYAFNWELFVRNVQRGIQIALRNFMWEYFFFVILYIICMIGWNEPKQSPIYYITFFIGFFYYGFSFIDYYYERKNMSMDQSILAIRQKRGLAIAIGTVYSLLILVPIDLSSLFEWWRFMDAPFLFLSKFFFHSFLWICASSAPVLASVASTIAMLKEEKKQTTDNEFVLPEEPGNSPV